MANTRRSWRAARRCGGAVAIVAAAALTVPSSAATEVTRHAGATRYETAVAVAGLFGAPAPVVYVASGERFPDALAGAPAATRSGPGPVLLTPFDTLTDAVAAELARLDPARIVVLGGDAAVAPTVATALSAHAPVERIAGQDRYDTAARIARSSFDTPGTVLLATGEAFPDALAAAAAGAARGWPVLLTTRDTLPGPTAAALGALAPSRVVIVGATGAVSAAVEAEVRRTVGEVIRLGGSDRYATSAAVAAFAFAEAGPVDAVFLATGRTHPDALAGAAAAGLLDAPLLLVPGDCVPPVVGAQLDRLAPGRIHLLGGDAALAPSITALPRCVTEPRFGPRRLVARVTPTARGEATNRIQVSIQELATGDLTGDRRNDVVVTRFRWASPETWPITILVNDGAGGFADRTDDLIDGDIPHTQQARRTIVSDFNGDERPDVVIADTGVDAEPFAGYVNHLLLSRPDGRYVNASANIPVAPGFTHAAAAGDVDGDGDVDLFLGEIETFHVLINDGSGRFTASPSAIPDGVARRAGWVASAALVDVDGDGSNDLVTNSDGTPSFVLLNDGGGHFTELPAALPPKPLGGDTAGTVVKPFDLDGDRYTDLLMAFTKRDPYYQGRWIQFLVNNGDGTFRDETARRLPQSDNASPWVYDLVTGDLNSDGFVDLAIDLPANFAVPGVLYTPPFYLNRGDGTFVELSRDAFAEPTYAQLRLVDVDGDGRLDVFSAWASTGEPETYVVSDRVG